MCTHNIHYGAMYLMGLEYFKQDRALKFAIASQMVDEVTPSWLKSKPNGLNINRTVTQVTVNNGLLLGGLSEAQWEEFNIVHYWHFGGKNTVCPKSLGISNDSFKNLMSIIAIRCNDQEEAILRPILAGMIAHRILDHATHEGYTGFPSKFNYLKFKQDNDPGFLFQIKRILGGIDPSEVWGHMLNPELDYIENRKTQIQEKLIEASEVLFDKSYGIGLAERLEELDSEKKFQLMLQQNKVPKFKPFEMGSIELELFFKIARLMRGGIDG